MELVNKKKYKGKVLCVSEKKLLIYYKGRISLHDLNGMKINELLKLKGVKYYLTKIRLIERILRLEPRFAIPGNDKKNFYISWNKQLIKIKISGKDKKIICNYREGMNNPLAIHEIKDIQGFDNGFIFGDYFNNFLRGKVNIYHLKGEKCENVYTFPENTILHVHGCVPDCFHNRVLILTGDSNKESGIWVATDNFKKVEPLLVGSQQYRTCVAFPSIEGIVFATDTPLEDNAVYFYSNETKNVVKIYDMPGPCIYGTKAVLKNGKEIYLMTTSVEPDSTLPRWRYVLTRKLGAGVKQRQSFLIAGNMELGFRVVTKNKKDMWPMLLFQFGNSQFAYKTDNNEVYQYLMSVKKYDGKTLSYEIKIN